MRGHTINAAGLLIIGSLTGASALLVAQAMKPGHERVPPYREPSPYMSQADIQAGEQARSEAGGLAHWWRR